VFTTGEKVGSGEIDISKMEEKPNWSKEENLHGIN